MVVLDRVAVYADGQLEVLVPDDIGGTGEVLDLALADPLPHAGDVAEPCIGLGLAGAGHDGRDLFIGGVLPFKRLIEDRVESNIDASKSLRGDNHLNVPPYSISRLCPWRRGDGNIAATLDGDALIVHADDDASTDVSVASAVTVWSSSM